MTGVPPARRIDARIRPMGNRLPIHRFTRWVERTPASAKLRVAPASRALVAVSRREELSTIPRLSLTSNPFRRFANAGRIRQARETHALPGAAAAVPDSALPRERRSSEPFSACASWKGA